MYTHTAEDRKRLYSIMSVVVMPAIQRAISDASRTLVYETEGFHPDLTYGEGMRIAADEVTQLLSQYFASLPSDMPEGLFNEVTSQEFYSWLKQQHVRQPAKV
jgi:hypothetical protein